MPYGNGNAPVIDMNYRGKQTYLLISTYLKKWLWLCKPKLPDIDIVLLYSKI